MSGSIEYGFAEVNFGKTHYFKKNGENDLRSLCGKFQWLDPKLGLNTQLFEIMPPAEFMCKKCKEKFESQNLTDASTDL